MENILVNMQDYMVFPIVILALLTGYVLKHWVSDETFQNQYIPVIVTLEGALVGLLLCLFGGGVLTAETVLLAIVSGGVSGAASSGLQAGFSAIMRGSGSTNAE